MIEKEIFKKCINYKREDIYNDYLFLHSHLNNLPYFMEDVCLKFLNDERIINCPASSGTTKDGKVHHHGFSGGLIVHTAQVLNGALSLAKTQGSNHINFDVLVTGAILHDWGKLFVYSTELVDGNFDITNNAILERHLPRSYGEFMIASSEWPDNCQKERLEISHIILSHHGHKEWGSPVECKTSEAYCVHLADVYSSRAMVGGDGLVKLK